jgi:hypothetical protein
MITPTIRHKGKEMVFFYSGYKGIENKVFYILFYDSLALFMLFVKRALLIKKKDSSLYRLTSKRRNKKQRESERSVIVMCQKKCATNKTLETYYSETFLLFLIKIEHLLQGLSE